MTPEVIQQALNGTSEPADLLAAARLADLGDEARVDRLDGDLKLAAVLVPLIERDGQLWVALTRRSSKLRQHAGQISFPGGRMDDEDPSLTHTALREAQEETALDPALVNVVGYLDPYVTITDYLVQPVVGMLDQQAEMVPDGVEATEIIEVPLKFVMDQSKHDRRSATVSDRRASYYVIQYQEHAIWGATAGMLVNFSSKLHN